MHNAYRENGADTAYHRYHILEPGQQVGLIIGQWSTPGANTI